MLMKATIEILMDVASEAEACDAISEAMRPLLREFGGDCFVDWRYSSSETLPVPHSGKGFEYADAK